MTLNDLECPIHLKVRFTDGTLDVRTLWLSDTIIANTANTAPLTTPILMGVVRGGGGEGARGSSPTLPPCGQLTRCFSAAAELLVIAWNTIHSHHTSICGLWVALVFHAVTCPLIFCGCNAFKQIF